MRKQVYKPPKMEVVTKSAKKQPETTIFHKFVIQVDMAY